MRIVLMVFYFCYGFALLLPSNKRMDQELSRCINNLANSNFKPRDVILSVNNDFFIADLPIMRVDLQENLTRFEMLENKTKIDGYVLSISFDNYTDVLEQVADIWYHNHEAKFLFKVDFINEEFLEYLSDNFIWNVVIVLYEDNAWKLYRYDPYRFENLHSPNLDTFLIGDCLNDSLDVSITALNKLPKQWRNTTLNVAYVINEPYTCFTEDGFLTGYDVYFLTTASEFLKFTIHLVQVDIRGYWEDDSFVGGLRVLHDAEVDALIGGVRIDDEDMFQTFEFSSRYYEDFVLWMIPASQKIPTWRTIISLFNITSWMLTLSSFCFVVLIVYADNSIFGHNYLSISDIFMTCYGIFMELSVRLVCVKQVTKLLLLLWILSTFVLRNSFKSKFLLSLMNEEYESRASSLEEAVESGLEICIDDDMLDQYNYLDGSDWFDDFNVSDPNECLSRTITMQKSVTLQVAGHLKYIILQNLSTFTDTEGDLLLDDFGEYLLEVRMHYAFAKDLPLYPLLDKLFTDLTEIGYREYIIRQYDFYQESVNHEKKVSLMSHDINLEQVKPAFLILGIGHLIATAAFLYEKFSYQKSCNLII